MKNTENRRSSAVGASPLLSRVKGEITPAQYVKSIEDRVQARREAQRSSPSNSAVSK